MRTPVSVSAHLIASQVPLLRALKVDFWKSSGSIYT